MTIEQINQTQANMTPQQHAEQANKLTSIYEQLALIVAPKGKGQWIPGGSAVR